MKILFRYTVVWASMSILLLFSQCRKSDRNTEEINPAPQENAIANVVFNDLFRVVHSLSVGDTLINGATSQGNVADICIDGLNYAFHENNFPNTLVVDFGDDQSPCSLDGRVRNGKLRLDYSAAYGEKFSIVDVEFIGFCVDSIKIDATMSITNKGTNTNGENVFKVLVSDADLTKDTLDLTWNGNRNYTMKQGSSTVSFSDDEFDVSGDSDGTTSKGNTFVADIVESLVTNFSCNWFSSGAEDVVPTNMTTRSVDYGINCSSTVTVEYYATEHEFTLE